MSHAEAIDYDPLKAILGRFVSRNVLFRRLFYTALGMLFLRQWHVRAELKQIAKSQTVKDIFDAGSGFGQYTYLMGRLFPGAKIAAVDVKPEQIEDCNWFSQRVGQTTAHFEVGDLTTFVKPNSFDLALSVDVMEHIAEDAAVYRNVFASLRPGGVFIIATPRAAEEEHDHDGVHSVIGEHVREGYTEKEFRGKLERAGFTVESLKPSYGPVWGMLAWMILQRIPMKLLSISKLLAIVVVPWMIVLYLPAALFMALDVAFPQMGGAWVMRARKG